MKPSVKIVQSVRDLIFAQAPTELNLQKISASLNIPLSELVDRFPAPIHLIEAILAHEEEAFQRIFYRYDFTRQNAIDNLILVGQEVYLYYRNVNFCTFARLRGYAPEITEDYLLKKLSFITHKIEINLQKGAQEGIYKANDDLSPVARHFLLQLISPDVEKFCRTNRFLTFGTLFNDLFETFLIQNTTPEGWHYYETRKHFFESLNFGRTES